MALRMDEQSPKAGPDIPARSHFHLTLGLIFIPFGSVIAGWTLAILDVLKGYANPAELKWTRLLVGLVLVDALVVVAVYWMAAHAKDIPQPSPPRSVIGVTFESEQTPIVREVLPGLPGERAGLQPGDEIQKIDAAEVTTQKTLIDSLQSSPAGQVRTLTVKRGDEILTLPVTPEAAPKLGEQGLFETWPVPENRAIAEALSAFVPAMLVVGVLALLTRMKRRGAVPVWLGFVLASVASFGSSYVALHLGKSLLGGWSLGLILIALVVQMSVLLGMTWVARQWLSRDPGPSPVFLPPLKAGLQGLFYLISGFPRVIVLLWVADLALFEGRGMGDQTLERIAGAHLGVLGTSLFVFDVVLLGPFAEESLFRGFLLPRLAAQWGETPALVMSSLIFALFHAHYGPYMALVFFYGWVFGWARLRSGSIVASTGLHMTVNGLVTALMFGRG
jgi:membrane protease YdiL (CAAX protease family)